MEIKTLNEQIERLRELIRKCYGAVAGKNGTVPEVGERNMENLPAAIGSIKSASEVPKVKVSSFKVTDDCINEDGRYEGDTLIDISNCKDLSMLFYNLSRLCVIDVSNWDTSNVTNMYWTFRGISAEHIDVSNWDVSKVTNMQYTFGQNEYLTQLDLTNWVVSNVVNFAWLFTSNTNLQTLVGYRKLDDVVNNNIGALNGAKEALSVYGTILDRASLRAVINGLADVTDQPAESRPTLTLGAVLMAKLTEEDIAIANNKGWDVA